MSKLSIWNQKQKNKVLNYRELENSHVSDIQNQRKKSTNFTVISRHQVDPGYIGNIYFDYIRKSSACQDAIINKFYNDFESESILNDLRQLSNDNIELLEIFENKVTYGDRKIFSYYYSLLDNANKFFKGEDDSFGYALNFLNINSDQLQKFVNSDLKDNTFYNFLFKCVGFNNLNDFIVRNVNELNNVNENLVFSITETTAILSQIQLANVCILNGNNKSLTHGTIDFSRVTGNDNDNYLTFHERQSNKINIVLGNDFNNTIHLNYFSDTNNVNAFEDLNFNTFANERIISNNPFIDQLIESEYSYLPENLEQEKPKNRHLSFVSFDTINQNITNDYSFFMNSILKANYSITALGVVENNSSTINYNNQTDRTFIQNSNIEINNILFGKSNSLQNSNLSKVIQATKKKVSKVKNLFSNIIRNTIYSNDALIKNTLERSVSDNKVNTKLGITYRQNNNSLINRSSNLRPTSLFLYDNHDVFESNNFLTNRSGFDLFKTSNLNELNDVINIHASETQLVEDFIENYYNLKINNVEFYKDLLFYASEGVSNSLERYNESNYYEYGNLPVHLIEEVAFISRFTGNTNNKLEQIISNKENFIDNLLNLFLYSVNNKEAIDSILDRVLDTDALLSRFSENITYYNLGKEVIEKLENNDLYGVRVDIPIEQGEGAKHLIDLVNAIKANSNVGENTFNRYAKDINTIERKTNELISPRYFTICGIPLPDIYSGLRPENFVVVYDNIAMRLLKEGFRLYYVPFVGFVSIDVTGDISHVNSFHPILKQNNILNQFLQEKNGIISSYVNFLKKYINKANLDFEKFEDINDQVLQKNLKDFIKESFEAYSYIVISKLSQTFEYSSTLNAVKIFSEAPLDLSRGYIPSSGDDLTPGIEGLPGLRKGFVNPNPVQEHRSISTWYKLNNDYIGAGLVDFWLYPRPIRANVPYHMFFQNYFDKSSVQRFNRGWDGKQNQISGMPSSIDNILNTLYYQNRQAKENFIRFYTEQLFTDEIAAENDPGVDLVDHDPQGGKASKFTAGIFYREIVTQFRDNNLDLALYSGNNNKYVDDLFLDAETFLYNKNSIVKERLVGSQPYNDPGSMGFVGLDPTTRAFAFTQYNYGYPLIYEENHILNMYKGFVEKSYTEICNRVEASLFFEASPEENKDAIFNTNYKIYTGLFSSDLTTSYLLDAYRYAFKHLENYKLHLESLVEEAEEAEDENTQNFQEEIDEFSINIARHYDQPENFNFNSYISHINASQIALMKYNSKEKVSYLEKIINNIDNPSNNKNLFNDANNFYKTQTSLINEGFDLDIICIGFNDSITNIKERNLSVQIVKFDENNGQSSDPFNINFNFDYYVKESSGNERSITDYKVLKYSESSRTFSNIVYENLNNEDKIKFRNHVTSFLAMKYLTVISGFGISENSLRSDLKETKARKSEQPRVISSRLRSIKNKMSTLNDEFIEMLNVSEDLINDEGEFSSIQNNIDYNVKNDRYTDVVQTNLKGKQDIFKRLIHFDYNTFSVESLGEIYMPKEFTKILYIPVTNGMFNFQQELTRPSNTYSLNIDVSIE